MDASLSVRSRHWASARVASCTPQPSAVMLCGIGDVDGHIKAEVWNGSPRVLKFPPKGCPLWPWSVLEALGKS